MQVVELVVVVVVAAVVVELELVQGVVGGRGGRDELREGARADLQLCIHLRR